MQAPGYLLPSSGDGICRWCQYTQGNDYLSTLNISAGDKWPDFGYFCVFVLSNYALVYFFIWSIRIKGWGFGMGYLFGGLGKLVELMKKLFSGMGKNKARKDDAEGTKAKDAESGTVGAEKGDVQPDASQAKAQKANDATGEEGAHTMGGV